MKREVQTPQADRDSLFYQLNVISNRTSVTSQIIQRYLSLVINLTNNGSWFNGLNNFCKATDVLCYMSIF